MNQQTKCYTIVNINLFLISAVTSIVEKLGSPWGGTHAGVALCNTCPIDNILSMLLIEWHRNSLFRQTVMCEADDGVEVCQTLLKVIDLASKNKWDEARFLWMTKHAGGKIVVS